MENLENEFDKKPKMKKGLIIALAIIVVVIALCLAYFLVLNKPSYIFNKGIDKLFGEKTEEYDTAIAKFKIKASMDSDKEQIKTVNTILEDCQINFETQIDKKNKKEIAKLGLNYNEESAVSAQIYYDNGEEYILLEELFDKYIKLNITEEQKKQIQEIFDSSINQQQDIEKIKKIIKEEIKKVLKEQGEFSKDSETINIDGKDVKLTKNTLTFTEKQSIKAVQTICLDLSKNDEFIDIFEESPKEELEKISNEIKDQLEDEEYNTKSKIEITIYTKGILKKFSGIETVITDADKDSKVKTQLIKENEGTYSFTAKSDNTSLQTLNGKINIEKTKNEKENAEGKIKLSLEIPNAGTAKLEIEYDVELNGKIENLDTEGAVEITKITDNEKEEIFEKLYERPLIGNLIKNMLISSKDSLFNTASSAKDETQKQLEEEQNSTNNNSSEKLTTKQNEIYDEDYRIEYSVPEGFEFDSEWSLDSYKYYNQGDYAKGIEVKTEIDYFGVESSIKNEYESAKEYYDNVKLQEEKKIEVNGKTFKYQTISYENYGTKKQKTSVWYNLEGNYSFLLTFDATETDITEDVIKEFLNITITEE